MIKIAEFSNVNYRHSAVLFNKNSIVNYGYNNFITRQKNKTVHAEIQAMSTLKNCKGLDIFVIRTTGNSLCNSRPCNNCILKMRKKGIRKVYYSNSKGTIECEYVNTMPLLHCSKNYKKSNLTIS